MKGNFWGEEGEFSVYGLILWSALLAAGLSLRNGFPAAHMPASKQLAWCPPRHSMLLLTEHGPQMERDTQEERESSVHGKSTEQNLLIQRSLKADHNIHTPLIEPRSNTPVHTFTETLL